MRIFFDIDGTLVDHKSSERAAVFGFYDYHINVFRNLSREEFYSLWHNISDKHFARFLRGEITFQGQRQERIIEVFNIAGIALTSSDADLKFKKYLQAYEQHWKLFDDVVPCLQGLIKYHRLGIISNGNQEQQLWKLNKMQVRDYFDSVVVSGAVGASKPDQRIFQIACEMVEVSPNQACYVGDDLNTDIVACQNADMKGIWINRYGVLSSETSIRTIFSLEELNVLDFSQYDHSAC